MSGVDGENARARRRPGARRRASPGVKPSGTAQVAVPTTAEIPGDVGISERGANSLWSPAARVGLREQNKRDKLFRIIEAGRELFGRYGFEATTMREVAAAARVGAGTLFLYAHTKEDLLVLVFLKELRPVIDKGFQNIPLGDLLSQFVFSFQPILEHHARNMLLSRPFLRDSGWVSEKHVATFREFTASYLQQLSSLVDAAKVRGEIRNDIDSTQLANCVRIMFLSYLRSWVAGHISRSALDAGVEASLRLLFMGLGSSRPAVKKKNRSRKQ